MTILENHREHGLVMPRWPIIGICLVAFAVSACSEARRLVVREKRAPDEFAVYQRAPLSVPPDFGLRPPAPGSARPQNQVPENQARQALSASGSRTSSTDGSPGTDALLAQLGADRAEPDIRSIVDRETSIYASESESFVDRIVFWQTQPPFGNVVEPTEESRRLRENQALGRPLNDGEVPTVEPDKKAILEGIFD